MLRDTFMKCERETFEKCFPLMAGLKAKAGDPALAGLTTDIHSVFRGLKFERNVGIGQKRMFFKGLWTRVTA
jgi:hypothetical protein